MQTSKIQTLTIDFGETKSQKLIEKNVNFSIFHFYSANLSIS